MNLTYFVVHNNLSEIPRLGFGHFPQKHFREFLQLKKN